MRSSNLLLTLLSVVAVANNVSAFSSVESPKSKMPMFEYLKFDKKPQFDVLAKTKEYVQSQKVGNMSEDWYADDYVLRGPVIGPISRKDLRDNQQGLGFVAAFPDIKIDTFGYTVDPENPYRCFYFQRWRATHTEDMNVAGTVYPASGKEMETPVATFCAVWNPEGKLVYEQVGAVVDRLEGNTQGKAAVFGLLHTGGLTSISASPGDKVFNFIQKIGHFMNNGRSWSKEEDIPKWWISPSRGAEGTEQW